MPSRRKPVSKPHSDEEDDLLDVDDIDAGDAFDGEREMDVNEELRRLIDPDYAEKFVASLHSAVQARVRALQGMQGSMNEIHSKYAEEHKAIEKKYEALYAPLFAKRLEILCGDREPAAEEVVKGEGDDYKEPEDSNKDISDSKGVPEFWLTAMKNHEAVSTIIEEHDEDCLKALTNISAKSFDDPDTGFTLEFNFAENPFFTNTLLTKTYHLVDEDEVVLDKSEGCEIEWKAGKNLTVKVTTKKQKAKGGKQTRQVTKEEPCDSFFNFFKPPQIPDDADDDEDDMDEALEEMMEQDYEIGCILKDTIIPKAVNWYTGEAADHDDADDENEDGAFHDSDEDSEEAPQRKGNKKGGKVGGGSGSAAPQPECKQQ